MSPFAFLPFAFLLSIPAAAQAVCSWQGPYADVPPPLVTSTSGAAITQAQFNALAPVPDVITDCGSYIEKVTTSYSLGAASLIYTFNGIDGITRTSTSLEGVVPPLYVLVVPRLGSTFNMISTAYHVGDIIPITFLGNGHPQGGGFYINVLPWTNVVAEVDHVQSLSTITVSNCSGSASCRANFSGIPSTVFGTPLITTVTTTYSLAVSTCPVSALTALPFNDACAQVLENINSTQAQKDAACGMLTSDMQAAVDRFANKLAQTYVVGTQTPIPLVITSQRRNYAYQAHLKEIWDKMEKLVPLMEEDPVMQTACATRRAEIAAEKGCDNADVCTSCYPSTATRRSHCLKGEPAPATAAGDTHINGTAIDVSMDSTVVPLQDVLDARNPPQDIQKFLDAPTATDLRWGGNFTNPDPVHFQVPR